MFDTTQALASDLMAPIRGRLADLSAAEPHEADPRSEMGRGLTPSELDFAARRVSDELDSLRTFVSEQLPWISKTSGEPAGMWVESVGRIDNRFEPLPVGTPYAWVAVASWEAAEAVYEALAPIARIDDARWVGGWHDCQPGLRKIKIYPLLPES